MAHKERLLKLAEVLESEVMPDAFSLEYFKKKDEERSCGYAAMHPWFKAQGLGEVDNGLQEIVPTYEGCQGCEAAEEFFGLDWDDFRDIFAPDGWGGGAPTPHEVAARIREFVSSGH